MYSYNIMSKSLDQTKIFGNTRKAYNADKLKEYIKDEHYKAKKYFLQYFAKKTLQIIFFIVHQMLMR
jgi:hypothetical protein